MKKERLSSKVRIIIVLNFLAIFLFLCILRTNQLKEDVSLLDTRITNCVSELATGLSQVEENTTLAFPKVIEQVIDGVIVVTAVDDRMHGAGYIHDVEKGFIITAQHVVGDCLCFSEPNDGIIVIEGENVRVLDIYLDPNEDFAIIMVDVNDPNYHPSVQLNLSEPGSVTLGELVLTIGHPFNARYSVSAGIVSSTEGEHTNFGTGGISPRIQFDAASNSGNSGGVLLNLQGEVIGIVVSGRFNVPQNSGVNYAVPAGSMLECLERFEQWLIEND